MPGTDDTRGLHAGSGGPRHPPELGVSQPLYRRVLGASFDAMPAEVQALHELRDGQQAVWSGAADVQRGSSLIAKAIAFVSGLPPAGKDQPLTVTFTAKDGVETWARAFGSAKFVSLQSAGDGVVYERVGPARLTLRPRVSEHGLTLSLAGTRVLGLPVMAFLLPAVATREYAADGRYRFEVEAHLPLFGLLVRYAGWLKRTS